MASIAPCNHNARSINSTPTDDDDPRVDADDQSQERRPSLKYTAIRNVLKCQ